MDAVGAGVTVNYCCGILASATTCFHFAICAPTIARISSGELRAPVHADLAQPPLDLGIGETDNGSTGNRQC